ncbi:MAG: LLM class flavin-dependent oxidoreductase [Alphaproteobacteria bacterium]|nr:LLM class flavin-dependent oxidoreductase [Alphaproteobacteria bacterium]MBU1552191.1 LLM class flavin-dependent oxidoreductase [Alphaproteobacteria bacterium]MBU2336899.1 LLM class flavin-dependent oxidoreductase [Alphaproteobacteria bacterium]MBU2389656.1 LLM class flavin-dependent oxidoreductase [Alphaproteobacteria bacterium]
MGNFSAVLVGDGLLLADCGERLLGRGHAIGLVATDNPQIATWAASHDLPTRPFEELEAALKDLPFDWLFSIANLRLLPATVLARASRGAINFHDALLPELAGLNTPAWAIIEGRRIHGVTWHAMTAEVDQGPIFLRRSFDIASDESALTLNSKCFAAGIESFGELLDRIESGDLSAETEAAVPKRMYRRSSRPPAAATLDFGQSAATLDHLVRGLEFGPGYMNPLLTPKIRHSSGLYQVSALTVADQPAEAEPGTVLSVFGDRVTIATIDRSVTVSAQRRVGGDLVPLAAAVQTGERLPFWTAQQSEALSDAVAALAPHEAGFVSALRHRIDAGLPETVAFDPGQEPVLGILPLTACDGLARSHRIALICSFVGRLADQEEFDLAFSHDRLCHLSAVWPGYFSPSVPLRVDLSSAASPQQVIDATERQLRALDRRLTYLEDVPDRYPGIASTPLSFGIVDARIPPLAQPLAGCVVTFRIGASNCEFVYDRNRLEDHRARAIVRRLEHFAAAFSDTQTALADLPMMSDKERNALLYTWNKTAKDYPSDVCVHHLIERQAMATADAEAVYSAGESLSYRALDERAEALAAALIARGVGAETIVGLHLTRSVDLVVAALAVWKAGGAYLPLDPDFPEDRLAFMIDDSKAGLVICNRELASSAVLSGADVLVLDDLASGTASMPSGLRRAAPENLAYVIYTSGSTGKPKGVMVEHRNVVNFFAGMDERVAVLPDRQNVWLAVTSLSFDISVLELFWTLSRGFKVVLHTPEIARARASARAADASQTQALSFGLFYWGNDAAAGSDKYRLLIEGAKFADANGFDAVWTPERHFHAFGGPFPNPSVSGAAVAAVTTNISIRAGSCVLPLHHPIRVVEEWAMVDNLSNGRVGLAFASGWMPEDFVLRPQNAPPNNKESLRRDMELVRQLWRGESVAFDMGGGKPVDVVTQPRPVQKDLPVWLTTAGNPQSYRDAASAGAHVLTHLLGQSIEELAEKIKIYRQELENTGKDPSRFKVTLMLHTLIGEDRDLVREQARGPLKAYLQSAAALIKQYAWAFPAFRKPIGTGEAVDLDLSKLAADEMDAILDFAFQRYFDDSGLFGTVSDALERLTQVRAAGVDEIACLIDWGLPEAVVLDGLVPLAAVVKRTRDLAGSGHGDRFADEVVRHQVTHLQSTPSMMRAFMMSEEDRTALRQIRHILLGGEALPGALVAALKRTTAATIENMYGPTETTIWSSSCEAVPATGVVPIGRPIANTQLYVLDGKLRPVPTGDAGELFIGGDGVARGYLNRPDLTQARFLANPFAPGRIYRTGDLVRFDETGLLHFLGRNDQQVKIRGHRIELGEIESCIAEFPGIAEAVVVARKDQAAEARLVAYIRTDGKAVCEDALRQHLQRSLPEAMVPADIVTLAAFPLTPNAKVDRNRLPPPHPSRSPSKSPAFAAPVGDIEEALSAVFARTLGRERVGRTENFFSLGGHSLLAVQMHRELKASFAPGLTITDLFRFPTVATLAAHIGGQDTAHESLDKAADRAALRRQALQQRQARTTRADALV